MSETHREWLLWQLIDSGFPTGGFAHSGGLEAAWQHGLLRDGDALPGIILAGMRSAARSMAPAAIEVHREPAAFQAVDAYYDANLTNAVANRASRAQGRALLATAASTFDRPALREGEAIVRREKLACHLPVAFGLVAEALQLDAATTARALLFQTMRSAISAAVRLGIVGPLEGQRVQAEAGESLAPAVEIALQTPWQDLQQTVPLLDLLQAAQDRLYSRLFQS